MRLRLVTDPLKLRGRRSTGVSEKTGRARTAVTAAAFALFVLVPSFTYSEFEREWRQAALPYVAFVVASAGGAVAAWRWPRALTVPLAGVLLIGGFPYFFFLPVTVLPSALILAAAALGPVRTKSAPSHAPVA